LILAAIELFFRSYYYESIITNEYSDQDIFTFTVGRILRDISQDKVLAAFLQSKTGRQITNRLGLDKVAVDSFLSSHTALPAEPLHFAAGEVLTLRQLAAWLLVTYPDWREWLLAFDLQEDDVLAVVDWVVRDIESAARRRRWWSAERLERVTPIAQDWSYGETFGLMRYSEDLTAKARPQAPQATVSKEVQELETVLARVHEAHALLVGSTTENLDSVLWQFARVLKAGATLPALQHKRLLVLRVSDFLAASSDRQSLEQGLAKLLNEAAAAGNVILGIDNLPNLLQAGEALEADIVALLEPYLNSGALQLVALAETEVFHRSLEPRAGLMTRFEKIAVNEGNDERIITELEDLAEKLERTNPVVITYPALKLIYANAEQYFQTDSLLDKATDLLIEAVPWALGRGKRMIDRSVVEALTKDKTSIPVGAIDAGEQRKLLGLEAALHARVIGQTTALKAVANAMRRGRTGIRNPKRPMGSFLFLGPTGVGKTETAKALAAVFFGREDALLRLDMSEYQSADALSRLIGSFESGQPGVLANLLRQNPYGVLLLDEFEKTNREVLNLFLQILDEGFFSDMNGKRVNARNIIFIATSNAGAELLWQMVKAGRDPVTAKDELVNNLVSQGIYKPELLNRFDDVIVFHPLAEADLLQVARLQLERLASRVKKQGIIIKISDELVATVVAKGSNAVFGARPMQRFIQDEVEQRLAEAMIKGEVGSGSHVSFDGDLTLQSNKK
jgi:ATP-dependent Clp protease ATP-binding subunit ClpC